MERRGQSETVSASPANALRRRVGRIARGIGWLFLALMALGALGLFVPTLPYVSVIGAALLDAVGPWVPLVLGIVAVACLWLGAVRSERRTIAMGLLAVATTIGYAVALWEIVAAARGEGTRIDVAQTLTLRDDDGIRGSIRAFVYGRFHDANQHVFVYPKATHTAQTTLAPIIVYIHGGGWVSGDASMRDSNMRHFAAQGLLPITLDYALSSDDRHLSGSTETELGCALAWIGRHAARLGGDPARIALVGESAGGNLVLNLAYRANAGRLPSACGGVVPHIGAVAAAYPVVDPASFHDNSDAMLSEAARSMAARYVGGTPAQFPARYRAIASATWIDRAAPPTLLLIPMHDHLVPNGPSYVFARQARAAGIAVRVVSVPYAEHAFDLAPGSVGNQLFLATTTALLRRTVLKPR
ncbi:alpha/beta hydrolase [uncultured Sphingomonas sp.]|uniref:alpha/beta hydrolase n=1 Tax=uncultured Sphingomonas sp. TaxID=158754 RepID=UPI00260F2A06|nr:alpha/beta hydrolase [uncultured Sphingomonas sp.]